MFVINCLVLVVDCCVMRDGFGCWLFVLCLLLFVVCCCFVCDVCCCLDLMLVERCLMVVVAYLFLTVRC